jgi:hypothetical protein
MAKHKSKLRTRVPGALQHVRQTCRDMARELQLGRQYVRASCDGTAFGAGSPLRMVYIGRERLLPDFHFMFEGTPDVHVMESLLLPGFLTARAKLLRRAGPDFLVLDLAWGGRAPASMTPYATHLTATLPVLHDDAAQFGLLRERDVHDGWLAASKGGLSFRASRDMRDFVEFYDKMYAPAGRQRFGDTGATIDKEQMQRLFTGRGVLLMVREHNEVQSAILMYSSQTQPDAIYYFKPGVVDAANRSDNEIKRLLTYHDLAMVRYARETGIAVVDFGLARAYARNEMYMHKHAIGCQFKVAPHCPRFALYFTEHTRDLVLRHSPLVLPNRADIEVDPASV